MSDLVKLAYAGYEIRLVEDRSVNGAGYGSMAMGYADDHGCGDGYGSGSGYGYGTGTGSGSRNGQGVGKGEGLGSGRGRGRGRGVGRGVHRREFYEYEVHLSPWPT